MEEPACKIAPSLLNSDFSDLKHTTKKIIEAGADWLHMDVMVSSNIYKLKLMKNSGWV